MKEGGRLSIFTAINNGSIEVRFTDTGKGIPSALREKIFEPFFTTKNTTEGSGLGLAIAYEIVQRYKGAISVESRPDKGATFVMRFPVNSSALR